jgi:ABC-2 type transport system ATP-binding protein
MNMTPGSVARPVVEVRNLTKRFGDFTAVDNISFEIREGEVLGVLGPNGAGKTTTIHMLLGLITPTSGSIRMFGLDLAHHRETILRQVNFSSTYISLPFSLTVEENLKVIARLYGVEQVQRHIDDVIKKLEMEDIRHKLTRKLSSGQMSRVTLAKAVMTEPKVLFLDEPTASLDPDIVNKIKGFLKEYQQTERLSMLYTSHNMREMEEMSDRIIFLQHGRIVAQGTAEEIVRQYGQNNLEEVFLKLARENHRP